jgi:hypothetical protein
VADQLACVAAPMSTPCAVAYSVQNSQKLRPASGTCSCVPQGDQRRSALDGRHRDAGAAVPDAFSEGHRAPLPQVRPQHRRREADVRHQELSGGWRASCLVAGFGGCLTTCDGGRGLKVGGGKSRHPDTGGCQTADNTICWLLAPQKSGVAADACCQLQVRTVPLALAQFAGKKLLSQSHWQVHIVQGSALVRHSCLYSSLHQSLLRLAMLLHPNDVHHWKTGTVRTVTLQTSTTLVGFNDVGILAMVNTTDASMPRLLVASHTYVLQMEQIVRALPSKNRSHSKVDQPHHTSTTSKGSHAYSQGRRMCAETRLLQFVRTNTCTLGRPQSAVVLL